MLEISVRDSGVGMTKSEVESLFKIDKVLSKPGTEKEMGSGLGLILCKEFIEKHGGDISVISTIDVGSEFKITLPNNIQPSIE
jgi:signal transduction histidine kinase